MKNKNQEFEETGAFLDVMSKRERKRWEQEQAKLEEYEQTVPSEQTQTEVTNNNTDISNEAIVEEVQENTGEIMEPIGTTLSSEELEKELEKTKEFMALTDEIPTNKIKNKQTNIQPFDDEEDDDDYSFFNPLPLLGFVLIAIIAFFIYIVLNSKYNNDTFILINSSLTILFTFLFGLTALSNQRHVKIFFIIDLLIILVFVIFNGLSIINYDNIYNKIENIKEPQEEIKNETNDVSPDKEENKAPNSQEQLINEYSCVSEDEKLNLTITEKDGYIISIVRNEDFKDSKELEEIMSYYEEIDGIEIESDDKTLSIEFDLENVDIDEYKDSVEKHNDYYRLESDFSYIEKNKLKFDLYKEVELKSLTCKNN